MSAIGRERSGRFSARNLPVGFWARRVDQWHLNGDRWWLAAVPIWVLRVRCAPLPKAPASLGKVDDGNGADERPEPSVGHACKPLEMQRRPK